MNYLLINCLLMISAVNAFAFQILPPQYRVVEQIPNSEVELSAGGKTEVKVSFKIKEGFHIQADKVPDEYLIPASITLDPNAEFTINEPVFPGYDEYKLRDTEEVLWVFSDSFDLIIPVEVSKNIEKGPHELSGIFTYQACNETRCLFPRELKILFVINVN